MRKEYIRIETEIDRYRSKYKKDKYYTDIYTDKKQKPKKTVLRKKGS